MLCSDPVRSKGYTILFKTIEIVEKEAQEMIELGVIESSTSPYSSGVVLAPKKDIYVRVCTDYRKLNKSTVFDAETMQTTEKIITKLAAN